MGYLNNKDKFVAATMALSTIGLLGALVALASGGARRASAEPYPSSVAKAQVASGPSAGSIGALVIGGISLSLSRRLLGR